MTSKNLGTKVSRVLEIIERSFDSVVFNQKRPPLDSEFNLLQEIQSDKVASILRSSCPSGFLSIGEITTSPEDRDLIAAAWKNSIKFKNPLAMVNGWIVHLGGGTNQFQESSIESIWHQLSEDEDEIAYILSDPPTIAHREDFIFLEVWQSLIKNEDTVYKKGFVQNAESNLPNDLIDPNLEIATTYRVQIQYRIRHVSGVDFISYREGFGHSAVRAQGPLAQPNTTYLYSKHPQDLGLYISGDGSTTSQNDLGTVDGYVYAIPILRIHRKNKQAYSLSNQNGSQYSILSGQISDRPDGRFNDEIASNDVEDLRHLVSLSGFDLSSLLEKNIYDLWSRRLPSELKSSSLDENVIGNSILQVDAISGSAITGADTSARTPNSRRRSYTEGKEIQKISFTIVNPTTNAGKLWFCPIGKQENSWEYELWDENEFYSKLNDDDYEPRVFQYDLSTNVRTEIVGGQWINLGEYRTFDYILDNPCFNKIEYIPANIADITNKSIVIIFDFITREGGGINQTIGGFNYHIHKMLNARNNKDSRPVDFNDYRNNFEIKELKTPRITGSFIDSSLTRSISRFEEATILTNNFSERYKGACFEVSYKVLSTGSSSLTIPLTVYERTVAGVFSVFNLTTSVWITPSITKTGAGFLISNLSVNLGDTLEFTLLCGNYTTDYVPHTKGIKNIATNYIFTNAINVGSTEGVINANFVFPQCDAVLANAGYFTGVQNRYVAYVNNEMIFLQDLVGLGTPVIKYTLSSPSLVSGQIAIHMLGYYNPSASDRMYFEYEHKPYKGIIQTRMIGEQTERFTILKLDDKISVTTAGSGNSNQFIANEFKGMASGLPISGSVREYNLFGGDIITPITGGNSSIRRISGRGGVLDDFSETNTALYEGQVLTLGINPSIPMGRGVIIQDPLIHERGFNLSVPSIRDENGDLNINPETSQPYDIIFETDMTKYNHLTQWSAVVEGLDSYKGELFLMVITSISTVYNEVEGLEHTYLVEKDLYVEDAKGMGKETILNNSLSLGDINQRLGDKIFGAVDIFPMAGRPLVFPK